MPLTHVPPQVPPGFGSNSNNGSPRAEASIGEYAERLNHSNNVCNALQTQVNNLQGVCLFLCVSVLQYL